MSDDDNGYQHNPSFNEIEWHFDPAADGARWRAWVTLTTGEPAELGAYERGAWFLVRPRSQYQAVTGGIETSLEAAKQRAFRVWRAMVDKL
jgi:hypothetical protein